MLEQIIRITVSMTVNDGQSAAFEQAIAFLTNGSKQESGTFGYESFANADGTHYRLVEAYKDAEAVEVHFLSQDFKEGVPMLAAACQIDRFEIYGDPGPTVTEIATGLGAVVFAYKSGLDR